MIQIDNLSFSYGPTEVLRNISMKLESGRIYGLLGENGVGKTTLLTLLCGLKKPQTGTISIDGTDPYDRLPSLLESICYLPDEVPAVNASAKSWATHKGKFWEGFNVGRFEEILKSFEVDPEQKMTAMSSGQLKKTHISFVLACSPKYIFMDEPTNGLDIPSKSQFRSALMKYTSEHSTIIISTHQVRDLESVIDPIVILDKRDVLMNATISEISEKLYFDYGNVLHPDCLYSEQTPGGFIQVVRNVTGAESKVNLEALFNAVHKNKELIKSILNTRSHE